MTGSRRNVLGPTIAALCLGLSAVSSASGAARVSLELKAQPLSTALREFARQTGIQIAIQSELVSGRMAPGVTGTFEPAEALATLLQGTDLVAYPVNGNTFGIRLAAPKPRADARLPDGAIRLAQAPAGDPEKIRSTASPEAPGAHEAHGASGPAGSGVEEIVVTGSRLRQRDPEGPSPTTVFHRGTIDALGVTSVPDALRYLSQQPYNQATYYRADSAQFAELRGLGTDTTLVLINGRRTMPSASSVSSNAFDMNSIPLAAVERIEVLSDSASAVYGADAVGGVINIILKQGLAAPVLDLRYGTAQGGAEERRYSLSAGYAGERLRGTLVLDYLDTDELLGEARDRWRNQDYRRFGGADYRAAQANPGNITSRTANPLPGLPSRVAAVPEGSTGVGLSPGDFIATAGQRNMESLQRYDSILPRVERLSAAGFGEVDLAHGQVLFGELLYAEREHNSTLPPPSLSAVLVPASNAFNPFGVDVSADFLVTGVGSRTSRVDSELTRAVLGARGPLGRWDWEASFMTTRESASSWTENALDAVRVAQALASSDPAQALNVFQDGPGGSPALLASLIGTPVVAAFRSDGYMATAFARGELFQLPAGGVGAVVGAEWREDGILYDSFLRVDENRTARAGFFELAIPVVGPAQNVPAVHSLGLKLAARYDDYSEFGTTTNPQFGLTWRPFSTLMLRASAGTSFRPPSLFELHAPRTVVPLNVEDPRRNNEVVAATAISGGNRTLRPIEGESLTAGFVWTPRKLEGLRVAGSWWRIELDERVSIVPYQTILAYESLFQDRVIRAAPSPADTAAGLPGRLVQLDITRANYGQLETSGVDASVSYTFDLGASTLATELAATWVHDYLSSDLPDSPPVERVGIASVYGTIGRWRGTASVNYRRGAWHVGATTRLMANYDDSVGIPGVPTGRRIDPPTYVDLQVGWNADAHAALDSSWLRGLRLTLGAVNLLDEQPPFAERSSYRGVDTSQADLRQRFIYVNVSKRF
jgi:iron complex outermembrane receptor protein